MPTYKIKKGSWECLEDFNDITEAQNFANSLGAGYVATLSATPKPPITVKDRLQMDKNFGKEIHTEFTEISRESNLGSGTPLPLAATRTQRDKFKYLSALLGEGSIIQAYEELESLATNSTFPVELKNYFLQKIANYLAQF